MKAKVAVQAKAVSGSKRMRRVGAAASSVRLRALRRLNERARSGGTVSFFRLRLWRR